jgi:hypothetical protein
MMSQFLWLGVGADKKIISSSEQVDSSSYWLLNKQAGYMLATGYEGSVLKAR